MSQAIRSISAFLFGTLVVLYAGFGVTFDFPHLIEVFRLTDPTGAFGWIFHLSIFLSNAGTILVGIHYLINAAKKKSGGGSRIFITIIILKFLEAAAWLPCFIGPPEALCGVISILLANATAPIIVILVGFYIFKSADRKLRIGSMLLLCAFVFLVASSWIILTPKTPEACLQNSEVTKKAACLHKFALKTQDAALCERIEFRSTRFACYRDLSSQLLNSELCEKIADPAGSTLQPYELPASYDRDICYWVLSFNAQDGRLCKKIGEEKQQEKCLVAAEKNVWKK